jgi:hypothetical protein
LQELALNQDVVVASCTGKYFPLSAALGDDKPFILRPRKIRFELGGTGE